MSGLSPLNNEEGVHGEILLSSHGAVAGGGRGDKL